MHLTDMSKTARRPAPLAARWGFAAATLLAAPDAARAQSAIIYGSLGNFDISNDTGQVCHGFEIELDGVSPDQVPGSFNATRYGDARVTATPTGTKVRWESARDVNTGNWLTRTIQHTVPWFSGQCYSWVPATCENGGGEHFGTYTTANPSKVTSRWLTQANFVKP